VSQADQDLEHYTIALGWAEEAVRHDPDNAQILNTLGVAQYRVGAYDKALATLTRSDELDRRPDASRNGSSTSAPASQPVRSGAADLFHPANAAFIAMAQFKLGHVDEAKASLARLRELMRDTRHAANEEYQAFLADAANLIEGPSRSPTTAPATQRTSPR
jgi:tetratricopeptide (TPR) repeat protein